MHQTSRGSIHSAYFVSDGVVIDVFELLRDVLFDNTSDAEGE